MAADYTRNIVFNVNDKAIKRATDRITRSLTNIEKTLQRIESKGFNNLAKEVDMTSQKINRASKSVNGFNTLLKQTFGTGVGRRTLGLGILGSGLGINKALDDINNLKRTASTFLPMFGKSAAISTTKVSALSAALSKLGAFAAGHPLGAGALAVAYMIFGDKIQDLVLKAGGAAVGAFANLGKKAFEASTIGVAGFKQLNQEINITTQAALKMNTLLARQNSMRGNVLRNTIRSERSRTGSDFLDFSIGADQIPRVSGAVDRPAGFIGPFPKTVGRPVSMQGPDRPGIQDPIAKSIRRNQAKRDKLLQNELRIRKNILKVEQQSLVIAKTELSVGQQLRGGQGFIGPKLPMGFRLRQQFQEGGAFFNNRGRAGRIGGAAQSGLIGGGFPLLFGQSPGAALAGGIGGALGGALGPGFGFAGSIVATAIAQKVGEGREFEKEINKLNKSIRLTGGESEFSVASIKKLSKQLGLTKEEALEAARSFEAFGAAARINLIKVFGDEATFNTFKNLRKTVDILNEIDFIEKKIGKKRADQAVNVALAAGGLEAQKFVLEEMFKLEKEEVKNKRKLNRLQRILIGITSFGDFTNIDKTAQILTDIDLRKLEGEQAAGLRKLNEEKRRLEARDIVRQISEPKEELKELMDPLKQLISLSRTVGDSFAESFKGIVRGSMTAQEALRNLFMRTADHFLDMAAQMIAKQIQMSILGIGLKFFGPSIAPSRGANTGGTDRFGRDFDDPEFGRPLADGGIAKAGRTHLVGERGPELFTPGVTGTVIPNHALGGGTNIVVNVDASGSSVEGDEQQGRELGRLISVAVQSELVQQKRPGGLLA